MYLNPKVQFFSKMKNFSSSELTSLMILVQCSQEPLNNYTGSGNVGWIVPCGSLWTSPLTRPFEWRARVPHRPRPMACHTNKCAVPNMESAQHWAESKRPESAACGRSGTIWEVLFLEKSTLPISARSLCDPPGDGDRGGCLRDCWSVCHSRNRGGPTHLWGLVFWWFLWSLCMSAS